MKIGHFIPKMLLRIFGIIWFPIALSVSILLGIWMLFGWILFGSKVQDHFCDGISNLWPGVYEWIDKKIKKLS